MNRLETDLRAALQRKEPPSGFAERVQLRVAQAQRSRRSAFHAIRWLAAAALLLVATSSFAYWQREQQRRVQGEMARAEALRALQISSEKLNQALEKIRHRSEPKEKS